MPTLQIEGRKIKVSDDFLKMSPDQQNAAVEEIAASLGVKPTSDAPANMFDAAPTAGQLGIHSTAQSALERGLRDKADRMLIGEPGSATNNPTAAGLVQTANTFALGVPRAAGAGIATLLGKAGVSGFNPNYGENYDKAKAQDEALARQNPISSTAGTVAGIGGQVAAMLPLAAPATVAGRVAQAGGIGAGMGAVESGLESKGDLGKTAEGALYGGLGGLAGAAAGNALGNAIGSRAAKKASIELAPTSDELGQRAAAAYKAAEDAGVWYAPNKYENFVTNVKKALSKEGYYPGLHPNATAAVSALDSEVGNAVTLNQLENLRRVAMSATDTLNKSDKRLAYQVLNKIDEFAQDNSNVIFGKGHEGVSALQEARGLWAAKSRSDRIQAALETARQRAETTGSGANIDNATRQELRKLLKYGGRGFSTEDKKLIASAAFGNNGRNLARLIGKFSPTGVVSSGLSGLLGMQLAGPVGLALPAVGAVAKAAADRGTRKAGEYAAAYARLTQADEPTLRLIAQKAKNAQLRTAALAAIMGANAGGLLSSDDSQ